MKESAYVPMKEKELAIVLQVLPEDRPVLSECLAQLLKENRIVISKRGKYSIASEKVVVGTFMGTDKGFGFVRAEEYEEDFFIPEIMTHTAMNNDTVEIRLLHEKRGERTEGEVIRILERGYKRVVGTFEKSQNFGFVIPDDTKFGQDIFVPKENMADAFPMSKVICEITDYGDGFRKHPEGKIIEVLGDMNDPGVDILSIAKAFDLPTEFPEKVLEQAERVAKPVSDADREGRRDLRDILCVTIDGEDAKDLDDAVSLTFEDGFYHLGVHIADVANYVQENSALDKEAYKRGTSVYLVDRVLPMLPKVLSNGMCSLNQGEDRLALSCLMKLDEAGNIVDSEIVESVICVTKRLAYSGVQRILDGDEREIALNKEIADMVIQMNHVAKLLREKRQKAGSIDFDLPESKIVLDEMGKPISIQPYDRSDATKLIEDFMLAANKTVAETFYWREIPFLYRVHESPEPEKMEKLGRFIANFGLTMKNGEHPKEIQKLLSRIAGTAHEMLITRLALRSMQRAKYTDECLGHFGLAFRYYCHFTSPIRRYPDLQIHRIIKDCIRDRMNGSRMEHYKNILEEVGRHTSNRERIADEAERETEKLKKAEFMMDKIGEVFEGVISGVTKWGIYVELPNSVEGLVPVGSMNDDYYEFDEESYSLWGKHTKKQYTLGQTVRIRVSFVDSVLHTIDFLLEEE